MSTRNADPSPFFFEGGSVGALLIHGFTGSPAEMRMVGGYLHQHGLTVSGPLLPGHGTSLEEMNRCRWGDWTAHAERALAELRARCETVYVGGLSMGSLLTLYLAAHHPDLPGIVVYSPAVKIANWMINLTPVMRHFVATWGASDEGETDLTDPEALQRLWHYEASPVPAAHELLKLTRKVRRLLPRVICPALVIHSTLDRSIHPDSARYTYKAIGSRDKELVTLHHSGHCLTVDSEWEAVAEKTLAFIQAH
ncbi:MAG: alpha/beta fold hydrolase [Anaerolineae bacterium]|nr:alpha/beta fold hydrolase [Anaerolineae bacterium]